MKQKTNLSNRKFIGVDLHTDQFTCCALSENDGVIWRQTFRLTPEALQEFYNLVDDQTVVSLEATSNSFKFKEVIEPYVGNVFIYDPHKLKLISMVGKKTDKVDAHKLAMYLKMQVLSGEKMLNPVYVPSQDIQDLRAWFTNYKLVLKEKQSIQNRIYSIFIQNLYQIEKKQMFTLKGKKVIMEMDLSANMRSELEYLYSIHDFLTAKIKDVKKKIALLGAPYIDRIKILTSIKGVSVFMAIAFIADFAVIERFKNAKHFTSYMRSAPRIESSNQITKIGKTNKHGRKLSISLITQSITHFKKGNPSIARWCESKKDHKSAGKIRMAVCRKVFSEMYHMLIKNQLHYHCDSENHELKLKQYASFLTKNGFVLNES